MRLTLLLCVYTYEPKPRLNTHSWLGPIVRAMPLRIEQFREVNRLDNHLVRLAR